MSEPSQGQDLLEGVYRTPLDLLRPVNKRWPIRFDLAANSVNEVPARLGYGRGFFYAEVADALKLPWKSWNSTRGAEGPIPDTWAWCNPPYGDIGAWTDKAYAEARRGAKIVMLLPSATGASWLKPCREMAQIVFLIGRPVFEFINPMTHKNPEKRGKPNTDPYGKDMLLAIFGQGHGVSWWDWRKA